MTRKDTESIIDIINQFAKDAAEIIEEPLKGPEKFSRVKHYLGHYCEATEQRELILDNETLDNCKKLIKFPFLYLIPVVSAGFFGDTCKLPWHNVT